jgi:AcrR family transcriptional regulator
MVETPSSVRSRTLPRGRHAAPRRVVEDSQRERILEGMAAAVADKGYARTAVADVIERAGVSRKSFYELYPNKEACFLAAYDEGVERILGAIETAMAEEEGDWLAIARAGTCRYLEMLQENPAFARTFLVEVLAAGPEALAHRDAVHARFATLVAAGHIRLREQAPDLPELPEHIFRATVGAIHELVLREMNEHGPERLPALADTVLEVQVALVLGLPAARALPRDERL